MEEIGTGDRELFEGTASELYAHVVSQGSIRADDPLLVPGTPAAEGFALLTRMGVLVAKDPGIPAKRRRYVAVDPSVVQSSVVTPMGQQGADLLAESSQWAQAFNNLSLTWRTSQRADEGPFVEVQGEAIEPFVQGLVADAQEELLTAQPQLGRNPEALEAAMVRDIAALERGVRMRTLYQHAARHNTATHEYAARVTSHGAEVRTLDEFFNRLIVVDRKVAIIPGHQGLQVAMAIRNESLVGYLVDMFERHWERARPFANRDSDSVTAIADEQRAMTIRMLIEGRADLPSAKRLGVSPRTYAGYVAGLKDEFDVETRFQLGYELGRRDIDGQDSPPAE